METQNERELKESSDVCETSTKKRKFTDCEASTKKRKVRDAKIKSEREEAIDGLRSLILEEEQIWAEKIMEAILNCHHYHNVSQSEEKVWQQTVREHAYRLLEDGKRQKLWVHLFFLLVDIRNPGDKLWKDLLVKTQMFRAEIIVLQKWQQMKDQLVEKRQEFGKSSSFICLNKE